MSDPVTKSLKKAASRKSGEGKPRKKRGPNKKKDTGIMVSIPLKVLLQAVKDNPAFLAVIEKYL